MNSLSSLLTKILEQKGNDDVEEIKVDLKRVIVPNFGIDKADLGYINYLFKHYQNEINYIDSKMSLLPNGFGGQQISLVENIRNYLIKIAIIRICNEKEIEYSIEKINNSNYCLGLFSDLN